MYMYIENFLKDKNIVSLNNFTHTKFFLFFILAVLNHCSVKKIKCRYNYILNKVVVLSYKHITVVILL